MRTRTAATLLATVLVLVCAGVATAAEHRSERGNTYVPDDLEEGEFPPVLVVESGLAKDQGKLWAEISKRRKVIIVETVPLRGVLRRPEAGGVVGAAVDMALVEAAKHASIDRCPWIAVGFSAAAPHFTNIALGHRGRFQGLIHANGATQPGHIQVELGAIPDFPVLVLHNQEDPVYKLERGTKLAATLEQAGLAVTFTPLPGQDHMAPMTEPGADAIAAFLETVSAKPFKGRNPRRPWKTVKAAGSDGLQLTADVYDSGDPDAPVVLLFHQARSSRGEYRPVGPLLVEAGFNAIAIDARSGAQWAAILNETAVNAEAAGLDTSYLAAKPDLVFAIKWARELGFKGKLGIWGSSYSAALVFLVGADATDVDVIVSFSPGEYLGDTSAVAAAARRVTKPTLIICPPPEEEQATPIFNAIAAEEKALYVQPYGTHGTRTIYRSKTGPAALQTAREFLQKHLQ